MDNDVCFFCSETYYDKEGNIIELVNVGLNYKSTKNIIDGFETYKITTLKPVPEYDGFVSVPRIIEKNIEEPEKLSPPDERYSNKNVYEYDSQGRISIAGNFNNKGRLDRKNTYTYDNNGRIIEELYETRSDKDYIVYKYDDKGDLIEISTKLQSTVNSKNSQSKSFTAIINSIRRETGSSENPFRPIRVLANRLSPKF